MTVEELKESLDSGKFSREFVIFKYSDNDFLPKQYLHKIRELLHCEVDFIEDIEQLAKPSSSMFSFDDSLDNIQLFECDKFLCESPHLITKNNVIVICKSLSDKSKELYEKYIVEFPKLELWHIKDYVYTMCKGVEESKLDTFINLCDKDIHRINREVEKLKYFSENERKNIFDDFLEAITDKSQYMIYDFTNAILKKDVKSLSIIYKEFDRIDIEPLGVITLLFNNFRNVIKIQLSSNPTPETCNMKPNQFWAIKNNNCGYYTKEELLKAFSLITDMDRKLKSGEISANMLVDYIVTHLF